MNKLPTSPIAQKCLSPKLSIETNRPKRRFAIAELTQKINEDTSNIFPLYREEEKFARDSLELTSPLPPELSEAKLSNWSLDHPKEKSGPTSERSLTDSHDSLNHSEHPSIPSDASVGYSDRSAASREELIENIEDLNISPINVKKSSPINKEEYEVLIHRPRRNAITGNVISDLSKFKPA